MRTRQDPSCLSVVRKVSIFGGCRCCMFVSIFLSIFFIVDGIGVKRWVLTRTSLTASTFVWPLRFVVWFWLGTPARSRGVYCGFWQVVLSVVLFVRS